MKLGVELPPWTLGRGCSILLRPGIRRSSEPPSGIGQPIGTIDPRWKALCNLLPEPDRTYCITHT